MAHPQSEPDNLRLLAAELAFELLLFERGAAHGRKGRPDPRIPVLGEEAFIFLPSSRRVAIAEVPAFLAALPSPAMVAATTARGVAALLLLDELSGSRRAGFEKGLVNQVEAVEQLSRHAQLSDASTLRLEYDERSRVFPLAAVKEWARRFIGTVGWTIQGAPEGSAADARFVLIRSDGHTSPL